MTGKPVTAAQMRKIDRTAIDFYRIPGIILMEHAGRKVFDLIRQSLSRKRRGLIAVMCGSGNNGGDGLVVARYLYDAGYTVTVFLARSPQRFSGDALIHYRIAKNMGVMIRPVSTFKNHHSFCLIVDALLGTGTRGKLNDRYCAIIDRMNGCHAPIISIDIPSGLDADNGNTLGNAVKAQKTVTLGLVKKGLMQPKAKQNVGKLIISDIGYPRKLIEKYL